MNRHIKIEPTLFDRLLDGISILGIALNIALTIGFFNVIPETIPTHFNVKGEPDGHGGKYMVFLLPVVSLVLFFALSRVMKNPSSVNYPFRISPENAEQQFKNIKMMIRVVRVVLVAIFSYLTWATIQTGIGEWQGLGNWFLPVTLLVLAVVIVGFVVRAFRLR